ncbi:MAG: hypothetical protein O2822_07360 [Chloroflexi bacterium]|nr:hypothetical protein [Chloroflexota bacterium]
MLFVALTVACTDTPGAPAPTPTATTTTAGTPSAPGTGMGTGGAAPSPSPASPSSTPPTVLPSPSSTPIAPAPGHEVPPGYAQSCASDVPWGGQVSKAFVCLDAPDAGVRVARGGTVQVRGVAGGSFESNVVVEVRALVNREPAARLAMSPLTYAAPDLGMPGMWEITLTIPATATVGPARVSAHFDSPKDGSTVAQAAVDIVID